MQKTILLHVLTLLSLVVIALSGMEAAVQFTYSQEKFASPKGWVMMLVLGISVFLYIKLKRSRKREFHQQAGAPLPKKKANKK